MTLEFAVWEQLGMMSSRLEHRPDATETIAAAFRQLLRAFHAEDAIAAAIANASFCMKLHSVVARQLRREPSWDSTSRWLDSFSTSRVFFLRPDRVRVYDAMGWGLRSNVAGRFWPEPFEADLHFDPDTMEVARTRIRFGDTRTTPEDGVVEGFTRVVRDIEAGTVQWAFEWSELDIRSLQADPCP